MIGMIKSILCTIVLFPTTVLLSQNIPSIDKPKTILIINSIPKGARIFINDSIIGITPLSYEDTVGKKIYVRLTYPEYLDWNNNIVLKEDTISVNARLRSVYISMRFLSNSPSTEISLDGMSVPNDSMQTVNIIYGFHNIYARDSAVTKWPATMHRYYKPNSMQDVQLNFGQRIYTH